MSLAGGDSWGDDHHIETPLIHRNESPPVHAAIPHRHQEASTSWGSRMASCFEVLAFIAWVRPPVLKLYFEFTMCGRWLLCALGFMGTFPHFLVNSIVFDEFLNML